VVGAGEPGVSAVVGAGVEAADVDGAGGDGSLSISSVHL
jgi:hypothetical protein